MEELPPGFRFYPTEEELVSFYLHNKLQRNLPELDRVIPVVDIYLHEPWDLPRMAGERCLGEREQWFFFTPQQDREARGGKPNRTTGSGYWKATGSPGYVFSSSPTETRGIGIKKTMVFYKGRAPTGNKTHWKMNEYKAIHLPPPPFPTPSAATPTLRHEMSVCRVYITSGSSRAFDRRPAPSALTMIRNNALLVHQPTTGDANIINISNGGALVLQEISLTDSSDDSGGGGDGQIRVPEQEEEAAGSSMIHNTDETEMIVSGLQPFWEWEQLNWP